MNRELETDIDPFTISIVELDFHYDSVDGLVRIFQNHVRKVNVLTTRENLRILEKIGYNENVEFHELKGIKYFFLRRRRAMLANSDLVFINTVASDFGAFTAITNWKNVVLRIHNIHKQFAPAKWIAWPKTPRTIWKFISFVGRQTVFKLMPIFRRLLNNRVRHFTFPDDTLKRYVVENRFLSENRIIASLPLKSYLPSGTPPICTDELSVVIIGATDPARRNYETVIEAIRLLYETTPVRMKLTLLGRLMGSYGKHIVEELSKINHPDFHLEYFSENVPEHIFIDRMKEAHLSLSPFVAETRTEIFREFYGRSKTSGSILDFLKFGLVTLTPAYYNPPNDISSFILKYESAMDLTRILSDFARNPQSLNQLNVGAQRFLSEHYTAEGNYRIIRKEIVRMKQSVA